MPEVNPKLQSGVLDFFEKNGMIAKDKQQNFSSHSVVIENFEYIVNDELKHTNVQRCKVCTHGGADLFDKRCTGLPPIPAFDNLGVF